LSSDSRRVQTHDILSFFLLCMILGSSVQILLCNGDNMQSEKKNHETPK